MMGLLAKILPTTLLLMMITEIKRKTASKFQLKSAGIGNALAFKEEYVGKKRFLDGTYAPARMENSSYGVVKNVVKVNLHT